MEINKDATSKGLTTQDKNWELMSVLGMKWSETTNLTEEDREFLLTKVEIVKNHIKRQGQPSELLK
ncbi:MAG: hypothetical protein CMC98_03420 [Flavobacteriales bacterium]|jgi:hypothetical protein|nr:hypothetical protein [Flavobacteriales bacterium]|tara:strand:+ start:677 stop:874 length:198 start_codon:yes stop_codon:yes gene_type:complete